MGPIPTEKVNALSAKSQHIAEQYRLIADMVAAGMVPSPSMVAVVQTKVNQLHAEFHHIVKDSAG